MIDTKERKVDSYHLKRWIREVVVIWVVFVGLLLFAYYQLKDVMFYITLSLMVGWAIWIGVMFGQEVYGSKMR